MTLLSQGQLNLVALASFDQNNSRSAKYSFQQIVPEHSLIVAQNAFFGTSSSSLILKLDKEKPSISLCL